MPNAARKSLILLTLLKLNDNDVGAGARRPRTCFAELITKVWWDVGSFLPRRPMARSRGFQIVGLLNLDRLLIKSMLGMVERHLSCRWVETVIDPTIVISDGDTSVGQQHLDSARGRGLIAVALSARSSVPWLYSLKRPTQTLELVKLLNTIDEHLGRATERITKVVPREPQRPEPMPLAIRESDLIRTAGNFFQYLSRRDLRKIVDVQFAPGRSIMINHTLGEYCSAIPSSKLLQLALTPIRETAHGDDQASAEWKIARRILPAGALEDLTWQIVSRNSNGVAFAGVAESVHTLSRLPRVKEMLSVEQLNMAKALMRQPATTQQLARNVRVSTEAAIDFCNAAFACGLLSGQRAEQPPFSMSQLASALPR